MKTCPQCGFHHSDRDERCVRCGRWLDPLREVDPLADPDVERPDLTMTEPPRTHGWGWLLGLAAPVWRRAFIWRERLRSPIPNDVHERNPWVAGALSVVPGMGQIYNHQPKKAGLMFAFVALAAGVAFATLHHPLSNYMLIAYLLAALYAFHDGMVTARTINRDETPRAHRIAFYCAWVFYVCVFCLTVQFFGRHFLIQFRYIPHTSLEPAIPANCKVAIDRFTYLFRKPRVGDVVYYDPESIRMEVGGSDSAYRFDPKSMIERIVAGPGETFELRDGHYYRDGEPAPPGQRPLIQTWPRGNFALTAPEDAYVIIFSYTFGKDLFTGMRAPPIDQLIVDGNIWREACIVPREEIMGRVWFIYQPPAERRWVR